MACARPALLIAALLTLAMRPADASHASAPLTEPICHGQLHGPEKAIEEAIFDNCFLATTPVVAGVETSTGDITRVVKPIEDVQANDWVQAKDPRTGEVGWKRVKELHRNWTDEVWYVRVGPADCLPLVRQTGRTERHDVGQTGGGEEGGEDGEPPPGSHVVRCTSGHPWGVLDADGRVRFRYTAALRVGDRLDTEPGAPAQVVLVIERREEVARTYNFEVEGWHTYYIAGPQGQPGVLVHNMSFPRGLLARARARGAGLDVRRTHILRGDRHASVPGGMPPARISGFHHAPSGAPGSTVVPLGPASARGVYPANVRGLGATLDKMSTMFPDAWSADEVLAAVRQAAGSAMERGALVRQVSRVRVRGTGGGTGIPARYWNKVRYKFQAQVRGIQIEGYLSGSQRTILSAYPVH